MACIRNTIFMYHTCSKVYLKHAAQLVLQNEHTCVTATPLSTHSVSCIPAAAPVPPAVITLPGRTTLPFLSYGSFACFEVYMVKNVSLKLFLCILWNKDTSVYLELAACWYRGFLCVSSAWRLPVILALGLCPVCVQCLGVQCLRFLDPLIL